MVPFVKTQQQWLALYNVSVGYINEQRLGKRSHICKKY
jgi:hypothetical protein